MKVTLTQEYVSRAKPEELGKLIQSRVIEAGIRSIEVVPLDEAIGRLAAMGVTIVGDPGVVDLRSAEVESRFPAPTPAELEELCAKVSATGYSYEAVAAVEEWFFARYGVRSTYAEAERRDLALHNVTAEGVPENALEIVREKVASGRFRVDPVE